MAKDSRITAGELQKKVEFWGQKTFKKKSNSPYITTCCPGGLQEKLSSLIQKQSPAYSVIRNNWRLKWDLLLLSEYNKKIVFQQQTLKVRLVNTGLTSTPCVELNILLYFLCCWPIFLLEVLDILFGHMASLILSYTNR